MSNTLPLVEACLLLRLTYQQAYRLVLSGVLEGHQPDGRHWFVTAESVDHYRQRYVRTY